MSHRDSESGDESVNESRDDSDNNSEEGEKPSAIAGLSNICSCVQLSQTIF